MREKLSLTHARCSIILLLLAVFFFRKGLFSSVPVVFSDPILMDLTHQFYPWRLFGFGMLKEGTIPLWNPYVYCGYPFVANWHLAIFYPLNVIFLLMPVNVSLNISIAFHVFLASLFVYFFMDYLVRNKFSALVSGVTFMFCAPHILHVFPGHVSDLCTMAWYPLLMLVCEMAIRKRRLAYFLLGGVVMGVQILSGHAQYFYYSSIALFLYFVYRLVMVYRSERRLRPIAWLCIGFMVLVCVGLCLSAAQLIPGLEFTYHSIRASGLNYKAAAEISFPPENLLTFLVPGYFGDMVQVRYWGRWLLWEVCAYMGILPLLMAFVAIVHKRSYYVAFFTGLALISIILAFGGYSPLFNVLYNCVPGFRSFRGNAKFIFLAAYSISFLAGFGCSALITFPRWGSSRNSLIIILSVLVILGVVLLLGVVGGNNAPLWKGLLSHRVLAGFEGAPPPLLTDRDFISRIQRIAATGCVRALAFLGISSFIILAALQGKLRGILLKALIIAVVVADLWTFGSKYVITSDVAACSWPPDIVDFISRDKSIFRILAPNIGIPGANMGMNEGFFSINGYDTNNVGIYKEFIDASQNAPSQGSTIPIDIREVSPLLEFLNLKYLILSADQPFNRPGYNLRFSNDKVKIYEKSPVVPRAFIVHTAKVISDELSTLNEMKRRDFDPLKVVILDREPHIPFPEKMGKEAEPHAEITSYQPNEVLIRAELSRPGFLVLGDVYYPGWKAYVDGEERPILRADYIFRAVYLDEGSHSIQFIYSPRSFKYGAFLSIFSAVALAVIFLGVAVKSIGRIHMLS